MKTYALVLVACLAVIVAGLMLMAHRGDSFEHRCAAAGGSVQVLHGRSTTYFCLSPDNRLLMEETI